MSAQSPRAVQDFV